MHVLIGLAALNLFFLVWGYALLAAARRGIRLADCGLAFCAGIGGLSTLACLAAVAGHVPGTIFVSVASLLAGAALVYSRRRLLRLRLPVRSGAALPAVLLGLVAACYAALLLRDAYVRPLVEWDAWAIWTARAKALVTIGQLGGATSVGPEPAYPPLVPMMQSLVFRFVGSFNSQVVHVEYALLVIAFAAAMWRLLAERSTAIVGAAAAFAVLMLPALETNVPDAQADVPLAVFAALAAFFLADWIADRDRSSLALFAVFGALAGWTKNEGSMLVLALGLIAAIACAGRRWRTSMTALLAAGAALLATAPWRVWTARHGIHVDTPLSSGLHPGYLRDRLPRTGTIADDFWQHLGDAHAWFAAPYLLAVLSLVVFTSRSKRLAIFSAGAPILAFALFVWAYMIRNDPLGLRWLLDTSTARTTLSIGLVSLVLVFFQVAALLGREVAARALSAASGPVQPRSSQ